MKLITIVVITHLIIKSFKITYVDL